jgi:pimeloyl-ACP methyl ester carboxylesterase
MIVDSMRLHYLDWGNPGRPPVLFLHGGGLNAHTWDRVCLALWRDYHCYALDLRGHGDSEWSPILDYGLDAHAHDIEGCINEMFVERFVIVGHSLGGHAAIRYASENSERLAGLVVVDTTPFVREGPELAKLREFMLGASSFDTFDDAVDYVVAFKPNRDARSVKRSLEHTLRRQSDGRWTWKHDPRHFSDRYFDEHMRAANSLEPAAASITCPTLIIRGENSLPLEVAERFRTLLPDGHLASVDRASHNVQSDNPEGLVRVLRPFLAAHFTDSADP